MKLINDKITCMPGLTLLFFKKISLRTIPSEGQQGTNDCDDNKTTSTAVFKFPNEHKEKSPLFFISLISGAKYKTTVHHQVRLNPCKARKRR